MGNLRAKVREQYIRRPLILPGTPSDISDKDDDGKQDNGADHHCAQILFRVQGTRAEPALDPLDQVTVLVHGVPAEKVRWEFFCSDQVILLGPWSHCTC